MAQARVTTDHEKIRAWAENRGGHPATARQTEIDDETGVLRLDFDPADEGLETISWEDFFEKFDDANLAFLYQDKTPSGKKSRFHKFVDRDSIESEDDEDEGGEEEEELE